MPERRFEGRGLPTYVVSGTTDDPGRLRAPSHPVHDLPGHGASNGADARAAAAQRLPATLVGTRICRPGAAWLTAAVSHMH